ncbi:MAG TPA: AzlD domain-containing protein [Solirubrobacteraceae bacterium]|nr:AzlD domain-containing protein [Solirubrobacteraceae bacterium]
MTTVWITIALLTVGTVAIKATGPVILGGRELPPRLNGVVARLAPSLLAALVVVETFGHDQRLAVDESAAGLAAAAVALAARLPMFAVVVIAAAVTALLRAV